jgi:hypothetical protein
MFKYNIDTRPGCSMKSRESSNPFILKILIQTVHNDFQSWKSMTFQELFSKWKYRILECLTPVSYCFIPHLFPSTFIRPLYENDVLHNRALHTVVSL